MAISRSKERAALTVVPTEGRDTTLVARSIIEWRIGVLSRATSLLTPQFVAESTTGNPHMTALKAGIILSDFAFDVFGKRAEEVTDVPEGLKRFLKESRHLTFLPTDPKKVDGFMDGTLMLDVEMPFGLHTQGFVLPVDGLYSGAFFQVMPHGDYLELMGAPDFDLREIAEAAARPRKIY